ncbi:Oligosaccharide biosynthesis protein Alg14 like protein [anaerobic digester metagenome]
MGKIKILAIASSGGHWIQLLRLLPAFDGQDIIFVSTHKGNQAQAEGHKFYAVTDATRWEKLKLIKMAFEVRRIIANENPDVIISTGAAPGLMAIIWGWMKNKKTIWIDSIANVDRISMSGRIAKPFSRLHLTQWDHLADNKSTFFKGTVIS